MYKIDTEQDVAQNYRRLNATIRAHTEDEPDLVANLANIASFIYCTLPDVSWVGFYLRQNDVLVLGPFMGKPACTRIPFGKGVCGHVAQTLEVCVVPNVHEFEGHIACDSATNSEVVLPIFRHGELFGVLDLDSESYDRFQAEDVEGLIQIVKTINNYLDEM